MIDKKYIELMNREIDDVITPDEKKDLHHYLSVNHEAGEYYDELISASNALNQVPEPDVPENLGKRILNAMDFSRYARHQKRKRVFNFIPGFNFRYAFTFAAGLLAGIFIYALFTMHLDNLNQEDVSGTIGSERTVTLREIPIDVNDIRGNISLKEKNDIYLFEISLNSNSLVDLTISYPDQLKLENFKPGIPGRISLVTAGNFIKAANSGAQEYLFSFTGTATNPPPVHIELSRYGKKVFEREFALNR